jgi:prepilin-type N-terminal cleavage/methylation domain-containing protein
MKKSGFTVMELLVAMAFIGILAAVLVSALGKGCGNVSGRSADLAVEGAQKWARDMGYANVFISCVDIDSDGDGYVSCTVREDGKSPIQIECAGAFTMNNGCRMPKAIISGTR